MKTARGISAMLSMFYLANISAPPSVAQNLHLSGFVTDTNVKKNLEGVVIYALVDNQRKRISASDAQGHFSIDYPKGGTAMIAEKTGYRSLNMNTTMNPALTGDLSFHIQLPLIPLDEQASDKPYMQSEQKDFTLNTQDAGKQKVTRLFQVKDALTSQSVTTASICFEYTKVEKKECKEITLTTPAQAVAFEEADIINVVVEAPGYQTYRGNLILEKMDGSSSVYEIKMSPEVTILALNLKNVKADLNCLLTSVSGTRINMTKESAASFYALGKSGEYLLAVNNARGGLMYSEKVHMQKGLNYMVVDVPNRPVAVAKAPEPAPKVAQVVETPLTPLPDSAKNITIYFNQSEHVLLGEAKQQLDQLAGWLKVVPERRIRIQGHSDNVGDPKRNETLSEYRARVTYSYLLEKGIAPMKMQWAGLGGRKPVEKNDSEENKKKNRRVEITLIREK